MQLIMVSPYTISLFGIPYKPMHSSANKVTINEVASN